MTPAPFDECYETIGRARAEGQITDAKADSLRNELQKLRKQDDLYTRPVQTPEYSMWHDQIVHRVKAMIVELSKKAEQDHQTPTNPNEQTASWPPRDASGRIIYGPQRSGTREQIGWPLYGWSREDHLRWEEQHLQHN